MKSKKYKDGYTMEEMVDRIFYWWVRYKGKKTEDGKEFDNSDLRILRDRIDELILRPNKFKFNQPDMDIKY